MPSGATAAPSRSIDWLIWPGKARPADPLGASFHPTALHSLDVAACLFVLLEDSPNRLRRLATCLGISDDETLRRLVAASALHDIGKFSASFLARLPETVAPWRPPAMGSAPHWMLSYAQLERLDARVPALRVLGKTDRERQALYLCASGHHGRPVYDGATPAHSAIGPEGEEAAAGFAACAMDMLAGLAGGTRAAEADPEGVKRATWAIAGLMTQADWLGSDHGSFPYADPYRTPGLGGDASTILARYYQEIALPRARKAVRSSGLLAKCPSATTGMRALYPEIEHPSPLQVMAESVELPDGPVLAVIEETTGAGKTEGGTTLAHRMMVAGRGEGIFNGLPTQATSNAMFGRMRRSYRRLFAEDATRGAPTLALAHLGAGISDAFQEIILPAGAPEAEGEDGAASCTAFIADSRRKCFMADIGVGTIDQSLFGVLPVKFQALRLASLAARILIVDEAHAYDAYMGEELKQLLTFHASLGGSAIVMSATLTQDQRAGLVRAFQDGLRAARPRRLGAARASGSDLFGIPAHDGRRHEPLRGAPGEKRCGQALCGCSYT